MTRHSALTTLVTMTVCHSFHLTVSPFFFLSDYNFSASFAFYASPGQPLGRFAPSTKKTSYYIYRTQGCNNVKRGKACRTRGGGGILYNIQIEGLEGKMPLEDLEVDRG